MSEILIDKIVSGGQTGADRAALDWAIAHDVPHGGWCPNGRLAEDGVIAPHYQLQETPGSEYVERTEWNVRDADGTVVFSMAAVLTGGSELTAQFARQYQKPILHLSAQNLESAPQQVADFIRKHHIRVLNVAGPRASTEPGVGRFVQTVLDRALSGHSSRRA